MKMADQDEVLAGTPELSPLGKRIEMLRIARGLSKQQLARAAGISRQQLWRVLAGKSELTSSLRDRLAFVLRTDATVLREGDGGALPWIPTPAPAAAGEIVTAVSSQLAEVAGGTFADFVANPLRVRALLAACPSCDDGAAFKRAILDAIEDVAIARGIALPATFFELRRGVIAREL